MDREEMLKRLDRGNSALELSIEKWRDIRDGKSNNHGTLDCTLCEINNGCEDCILYHTTKKRCGDYDSVYSDFYVIDQKRKGAIFNMINALERCRRW